MAGHEEPMLKRDDPPEEEEALLAERIRALLDRELFGVLCTQGEGQPYGSLVALAVDDGLGRAVFVTGRATRKYRLLTACDHVALVVDDRDRHPGQLMTVEALTATGRAHEVADGGERRVWADLLLARHPALEPFVAAPSTALFRVDIVRYLHVWRFQEVRQWVPPRPG